MKLKDRYGDYKIWVVFSLICAIAVVAIAGIVVAIAIPSYYVEKNTCYSFGRNSEREVKWVMYNLVSWDCLTPTQDGKWISTDKLRDID